MLPGGDQTGLAALLMEPGLGYHFLTSTKKKPSDHKLDLLRS